MNHPSKPTQCQVKYGRSQCCKEHGHEGLHESSGGPFYAAWSDPVFVGKMPPPQRLNLGLRDGWNDPRQEPHD